MFYCESCREKRDWPRSFMRSFGCCELCGLASLNYDRHHSTLPDPEPAAAPAERKEG